jgi:mono/diheme cytochrome c family protein
LRNGGGSLKIPIMNLRSVFFGCLAFAFFTACAHKHIAPTPAKPAVIAPPPQISSPVPPPPINHVVTSAPTYVPDFSHSGQALPDGVFAWDALSKTVEAAADQDFAKFTFSFTNITTGNVTVLDVHPSCGCTTAELPPRPWIIPAGSNGLIKLSVNLAGKSGTVFKSAKVTTDKGNKDLMLRIEILPPVIVKMTDAQRAAGVAKAKVDRQAVFKGDCASCHAKNIEGKYGIDLYNSVCGICHEAEPRATMVPDLGKLTAPTSHEFWRTWITYGKPGSLMPAFATSQGGPLTDMQIASLASYLDAAHPAHVITPQ